MFIALSRLLPNRLKNKHKKHEHEQEFNVRVILLDDSDISLQINTNEKVIHLFDKICFNLNLDIKDCFGLKFINEDKNTKWLSLTKSFASQIADFPCTLQFGVKFYPIDPCKINSEHTRYHIFLQVKRDIYERRVLLSKDLAVLLSAYAVQSEFGDFDPQDNPPGYLSGLSLTPNQNSEFEYMVEERHKTLRGRTSVKCEFQYLDRVKWLDFYGVQAFPVVGEDKKCYLFGLSPIGILVFKQEIKVGSYFWCRILKFTAKSRVLLMKVRDRQGIEKTILFEIIDKDFCKYLCKLCSEHLIYFKSSENSYLPTENSSGKFLSFGSRYFQRDKKSFGTQSQIIRKKVHRSSGNASQPERQSASAIKDFLDQPVYTNSPLSMRSERQCKHNRKQLEKNVAICDTVSQVSSFADGSQSERNFCRHSKREHRTRSKSPMHQPPKELVQYFRYVDKDDAADYLQDIPYTTVQTSSGNPPLRFSPKTKNRILQSRRLAACKPLSELENRMPMPEGEAPPPYTVASDLLIAPNQMSDLLIAPNQMSDLLIAANQKGRLYFPTNQSSSLLSATNQDADNNNWVADQANEMLADANHREESFINLPIAMPTTVQSPTMVQPLRLMVAPIIKTKSLSRMQITTSMTPPTIN